MPAAVKNICSKCFLPVNIILALEKTNLHHNILSSLKDYNLNDYMDLTKLQVVWFLPSILLISVFKCFVSKFFLFACGEFITSPSIPLSSFLSLTKLYWLFLFYVFCLESSNKRRKTKMRSKRRRKGIQVWYERNKSGRQWRAGE